MKHPLRLAAFLGLMALPAQAFDLGDMNDTERQVFRDEVRDFLMENPQVIMEAVAVLEARDAEAQAADDDRLVQANRAMLNDSELSWQGGNLEGDVTLIEFVDYRCGYCRRAHDEVAELVESDGNIRLILKEFPILGEASLTSSRFAIATRQLAGDEAYKAVHDALITFTGDVTEPALMRMANTFGLDGAAIVAHMESDAVTAVIAETRALGQRLNINGTPTFVVQDEMVRGYVPLEAMRGIVADLRRDG